MQYIRSVERWTQSYSISTLPSRHLYDVIDRATVTGSSFVIASIIFSFGPLAEMAPNQKTVEQQTSEIIRHLLEDEFPIAFAQGPELETDSATESDGSFFSLYLQAALARVSLHIFRFFKDLLYVSALYLSSSMIHNLETSGQTLLCFIIHLCYCMFQLNLMLC